MSQNIIERFYTQSDNPRENYLALDIDSGAILAGNAASDWPNTLNDAVIGGVLPKFKNRRFLNDSQPFREGYDAAKQPIRENCACAGGGGSGLDTFKKRPRKPSESFVQEADPWACDTLPNMPTISCNANFQVPGNASCQSSRVTGKALDNAVNPEFNLGGMVAYGL